MRKIKAIFSIAVLATLSTSMVTGLCGCGGSDSDKTVVDIYQYKVECKDALEDAVKEYEKTHKDVKINVDTVGGGSDYSAQLKTKFSSGQEPAIYCIGGTQDAIDYKDSLEDLSNEKWVDQAYEGTLDSVTIDGKVYGMPFAQEGYGLIYNKNIFEEAGIKADEITTYAKLEEAVKTLDSKKSELGIDSVFVLPASEKWVTGLHLSNVAFSNEFESAKDAYEAKTIEFKYSDSLKKLLDLQAKYGYKPDNTVSSINSVDYSTQVEKQFGLGKAAIIQQGNWIYGTLEGLDEDIAKNVGILPIPLEGVVEDSIPVGVPYYWAVNSKKDDKVKKAAKEFLSWLYTSDEGKERIVNDFNFIPALSGYDGDKLQPKDPLAKEVKRYVEDEKTMPWVFMGYPAGWGENELGASFQKYFSGESTWDEVVDEAKSTWEKDRE